jgi:D-beta-D-heptose 7-phosphate kinase/D-beta-D-heptose 1-phosphate adenosyltransferase
MIAVIGDIMLDKYIYGSSTRMSPECLTAPVVKEYTTEVYVGGAGNTALNIKNLQSPVTLFCAISFTLYCPLAE